jgi:hypothetical protein
MPAPAGGGDSKLTAAPGVRLPAPAAPCSSETRQEGGAAGRRTCAVSDAA